MSEWSSRPLRDLLDLHDSKRIPLSSAERATRQGPYPYYGAQGVIDHIDEYIFDGRFILIPEDGENLRSRKLPVAYFAEGQFWVNNHAHIVKAKEGAAVDRFVQSAIQAADISPYITGAAQPKLSQANLLKIEIAVPDIGVQRRVAAVLDALDDLIENNRRRVEVLEEMARAIYREWFVYFRFPGHEDATFVDSDLGPIPEGWAVHPLGDLTTNLDRQRKPLSRAKRAERPGPFPYYGAAKLIDWVDGWLFEGEHLLFAEDGSVQTPDGYPVLQLVDEQFWANNHTHILTGDGVSTRFLYFACGLTPISGFVTGAAQPKITQGNLNRIPVLIGDEEMQRRFDGVVGPLMDERRELDRTVAPLVKVRDMLLPKLVTGQIDVSDLDLDAVVEKAGV